MIKSEQNRVLVTGGSFAEDGGKRLVESRSWEMIRLVADHFEHPVFAFNQVELNERLTHALPDGVELIRSNSAEPGRIASSVFHGLKGSKLDNELVQAIDSCQAVYLRLPLWQCLNIFRYAQKRHKTIIASVHGDWASVYRERKGGLAHRFANEFFARKVEKATVNIARSASLLLCVGEQLSSSYSRFAKHSAVIANHLFTASQIANKKTTPPTTPFRILFVGYLEQRKGIRHLLESIKLIRDSGVNAMLEIVGSGPEEGLLKQIAQKLEIESICRFSGYKPHGPALLDVFRASDLLVLPSVSGEGVPKVLMEAMSQGTPVVATDVGGVDSMLQSGKLGSIVEKRDSKSMANAIQELLVTPELWLKRSDAGIEAANRSSMEVQKANIRDALLRSIPKLVGQPEYLNHSNHHPVSPRHSI